jgi:hypothetical protein
MVFSFLKLFFTVFFIVVLCVSTSTT